jgi:hypothetical protein
VKGSVWLAVDVVAVGVVVDVEGDVAGVVLVGELVVLGLEDSFDGAVPLDGTGVVAGLGGVL